MIERPLAGRTSIVRVGQLLCRFFRSDSLHASFPLIGLVISQSLLTVRAPAAHKLRGQVSSIIIELARLPLRPLVESRHIYQDLTVRRSFDVGPVHGTRRRTLKVDPFAVVATAV